MTVFALASAAFFLFAFVMACLAGMAVCVAGLILDPDAKMFLGEALVPLLCMLAGQPERDRLRAILDGRPDEPVTIRHVARHAAASGRHVSDVRLRQPAGDPYLELLATASPRERIAIQQVMIRQHFPHL